MDYFYNFSILIILKFFWASAKPIRPCARNVSRPWLLVLPGCDKPFLESIGVLDHHVREEFEFWPWLLFEGYIIGASKRVQKNLRIG